MKKLMEKVEAFVEKKNALRESKIDQIGDLKASISEKEAEFEAKKIMFKRTADEKILDDLEKLETDLDATKSKIAKLEASVREVDKLQYEIEGPEPDLNMEDIVKESNYLKLAEKVKQAKVDYLKACKELEGGLLVYRNYQVQLIDMYRSGKISNETFAKMRTQPGFNLDASFNPEFELNPLELDSVEYAKAVIRDLQRPLGATGIVR